MRDHGWQLPYHPLQVVAIVVFAALAFAFYVFFVPFVGNKILEFHVIAVYSPAVLTVFMLYVKCAATNPADPGVLRSRKGSLSCDGLSTKGFRAGQGNTTETSQSPETSHLSPPQQGREKIHECEKWYKCFSALHYAACFKKLMGTSTRGEFISDDDMLYCSLCEVEIIKSSKHCRVCDKCVDCFDHHCRWLNNCIGKKNYRCFIALMISSISMLVLQSSVGIWVVTRCFLYRSLCLDDIVAKLGSGFSFVPFIVVVVSCTVLAVVATLPLGQLFCFHLLLIRKGISTYDYILAMREQEQQLKNTLEVNQTPATSPTSSIATAASGASSMGGLPRGSWCTPPHLFLNHQQAVLEPNIPFSSRELELGMPRKLLSVQERTRKKPAVKINPWALARLNTEDALRAAARARNNSSIMRHVAPKEGVIVSETDSGVDSSSRDVSAEIQAPQMSGTSVKSGALLPPLRGRPRLMKSWGHDKLPAEDLVDADICSTAVNLEQELKKREDIGMNFLRMEARAGLCHTGTEITSPSSSSTSPEARSLSQDLLSTSTVHPSNGLSLQRSTSDGYEASGGESADDSERGGRTIQFPWSKMIFPGNRSEIKSSDDSGSLPLEKAHAAREEVKGSCEDTPTILMQKRVKKSCDNSHIRCSEFVPGTEHFSRKIPQPGFPTSYWAFPPSGSS